MTQRKLYLGPLTDNRRWDRVAIRPDDVIVVTPPKSGTTWMQTIIALLLSGNPEVDPQLAQTMPWVDIRLRAVDDLAKGLDARSDRRSMKSHTPMDGLPLHGQAQYLCVFRHPLDVHFSFRNHTRIVPMPVFKAWYPEDDPDGATFRHFLDGGPEGFDGDLAPLAHILRHYQAAKTLADRPNVHLFHYADMLRDLPRAVARVAGIMGITHPDDLMAQLVQAATFDNMKAHADRYVPAARKGAFASESGFFHRGTCGQWHDVLTQAEVAAYDAVMNAELSQADRAWLEFGSAGAP